MSNIIYAVFGNSKRVKTRPVWRIDRGMVLRFVGLDLPPVYEVHFSNYRTVPAKTVIGDAEGVEIPPEYFHGADQIYAWVYLHSGEDDGHTECEAEIPLQLRSELSDEPPTPEKESVISQAISALNAGVEQVNSIAESIPGAIDTALQEAKDSGEFDGKDGVDGVDGKDGKDGKDGVDGRDGTDGKDGVTPDIFTIAVTLDPGTPAYAHTSGTLEQPLITFGIPRGADGTDGTDGDDGFSPIVTVTEITGGHRVSITDADGTQTFDVMDGTGGGGGTSNYNDLTNKPQIAGVTLSGNKSLADLGIAAASDIPSVPVASVNGQTGAVVLDADDVGALPDDTTAADLGAYVKPSGGVPKTDLASDVQTSLGKADSALQSFTETDPTVPSWAKAQSKPTYTASEVGALPDTTVIPSTATDVGAVASNQGVANAGKFMVVGSDGIVAPVTVPMAAGGSF